MPAKLKLYVKTWCPWCVWAKQYLNGHNYRYTELDVERDPAAYREMIDLSGQRMTPTLSVNGKVLADFGPEELENFLRKHSISP
jgi:glutaredoxin 3